MNSWPSGTRARPTTLPFIMLASALADQNKANVSETPSISSPRLIHINRRPRWGSAGDSIWMLGGLKERTASGRSQQCPLVLPELARSPLEVLHWSSPQLGSQTAGSEALGQAAAGSQLPTKGLCMPCLFPVLDTMRPAGHYLSLIILNGFKKGKGRQHPAAKC